MGSQLPLGPYLLLLECIALVSLEGTGSQGWALLRLRPSSPVGLEAALMSSGCDLLVCLVLLGSSARAACLCHPGLHVAQSWVSLCAGWGSLASLSFARSPFTEVTSVRLLRADIKEKKKGRNQNKEGTKGSTTSEGHKD